MLAFHFSKIQGLRTGDVFTSWLPLHELQFGLLAREMASRLARTVVVHEGSCTNV